MMFDAVEKTSVSLFSNFCFSSAVTLIVYQAQASCRPPGMLTKTASRGSMSGFSQATSPVEDRTAPPTAPLGSHGSMGSMASIGSLGSVGSTTALAGDTTTSDSHHQLQRRDSQGSLIDRTNVSFRTPVLEFIFARKIFHLQLGSHRILFIFNNY